MNMISSREPNSEKQQAWTGFALDEFENGTRRLEHLFEKLNVKSCLSCKSVQKFATDAARMPMLTTYFPL